MILKKEEIQRRLNSEKNLINQIAQREEQLSGQFEVIIKDGKNHEGGKGVAPLTPEERVAIGVLAKLEGNEIAAELMGVSENTARHIRSGQHTVDYKYTVDQNLKNAIEDRLDKTKLTIAERAAEKLLGALDLIEGDKLTNASIKDIAIISNNMSQIVRNMSNSGNNKGNDGEGRVKVIIKAPGQTKESSLDVIEIGIDR